MVSQGKLTGFVECVENWRIIHRRSGQNSYDVLDGANWLMMFTEWQEFMNPDFEQVTDKLGKAVIFDGRNLYDSGFVRKQGIEYRSIGKA